MTDIWSTWQGIAHARFEQMDYPGIYQVGMVDEAQNPIPICRLGDTDKEGIIYIGVSENVGERIEDFRHTAVEIKGEHDGASTYILMQANFRSLGHNYANCKLQYRVMRLSGSDKAEHTKQEATILADYFNKYNELPPCNSNFPEKWGEFVTRLQQLWGWSAKP